MRNKINRLLLASSVAICICFFISYGKNFDPFYGDAMGYYVYLPSALIYHNYDALDSIPGGKHIRKSARNYLNDLRTADQRTPKGYLITKYTCGVCLMEMPFFLIAHLYEKLSGGEADGYSQAYRYMLIASSLFYTLLGLLLLYKILNILFSSNSSFLGVLVILMGTNLFWFTFRQAGMAHIPLFFLYTLLLFSTIQLSQKTSLKLFMLIGFVVGLITLIRPTDIICILIPLLYNVYDKETLKKRLVFLKDNINGIACFFLAFIIPLVPQMLYWKKYAGSFLYYSYGKESFRWLHPKIFAGLFSVNNGWLIYSPVMVFSILGILFYKRLKQFSFLLYTLVPIYVYVIYSWYCYNYINGFGSRPMIHLYPLLAFPLTAFIEYVSRKKIFAKTIYITLFLFLISINISYSLLQAKGILFSEDSNVTYNLHMLYKMHANYADLVANDIHQVQPAENTIEKVANLSCDGFEDSLSDRYIPDTSRTSKYVYCMWNADEYEQKTMEVKYNSALCKKGDWLKCSGKFYCWEPGGYLNHFLVLEILSGENKISWAGFKIDNKIGLTDKNAKPGEFVFSHQSLNQWGYLYFYYKIPPDVKDGDRIRLFVWNTSKHVLFFDNICLDLYRNKNIPGH